MTENPIYQGQFVKIHYAVDQKQNQQVVVKIYNKDLICQSKLKDFINNTIKREYSCLKHMKHKNIIKILERAETQNTIYLFIEKCECTLREYIQHKFPNQISIPQPFLRRIVTQIFNAFQYINSQSYCHLDLKQQNILILNDEIKISDFGLATQQIGDELKGQGTPSYMSPEQLNLIELQDIQKHDVWSAGVMIYELVYKKHPYLEEKDQVNNPYIVQKKLNSTQIQFPQLQQYSPDLIDLLKGMLNLDAKARFSWDNCCNAIWIKEAI